MYVVDDRDQVIPCNDAPSPGVPTNVIVVAGSRDVMLSYESGPGGVRRALVAFEHARTHYLGSPNDETLHGHPLRKRGLGFYGAFEVVNSSWIRALEQMNSVHPRHDPSRFEELRHFIFTFQDVTFECIAKQVKVVAVVANIPGEAEKILDAIVHRELAVGY
jgi:hypothetical protein